MKTPLITTLALRPPHDDAGLWSRWPSAGDLRPETDVQNLYTVHVRLARGVDDLDEVVTAVTHGLSLFHLMTERDRLGRTTLVLTLGTLDLWQALLITMNAVTSAGHVPVALRAEPAAEFENDNS